MFVQKVIKHPEMVLRMNWKNDNIDLLKEWRSFFRSEGEKGKELG